MTLVLLLVLGTLVFMFTHSPRPCPLVQAGPTPTATEFFMSATAEVNSLKCSSGQYTSGWTRSPHFRPAFTQAASHSALLVSTAAWYFPVAMP